MTDFKNEHCCAQRFFGLCLGLLMLLAGPSLAQIPNGKPQLQNWGIEQYQGNSQNWVIEQGDDGLIYVGNGSSLLVFDGATWRTIKTRNDGRIRDLKIDAQGRIWVASPSDFGYYQRDSRGELIYHSISDELPLEEQNFGETRHVHFVDEDVYFNTIDRAYRWSGGALTTLDRWDGPLSITFVHNNRYLVFSKDRLYDLTGLPQNIPDPLTTFRWPQGSKGTFFLPYTDNRIIMGTFDDGIYLLSDGPAQRFNNDENLRDAWPYRGLALDDGSVLVSTINNGVFRLNSDGELAEWINRDAGLLQNTTTGMTVDHEGGLWLAQDAAIARVELLNSLRAYDADLNVNTPRALIEHRGQLLVAGLIGVGMLVDGDGPMATAVSLNAPIQESFDIKSVDEGVLVSGHNGVQLMQLDFDQRSATSDGILLSHSYAFALYPSRFREAFFVELDAGMGVLVNSADGWKAQDSVEGITERIGPVAEGDDGSVWAGSGNGQFYRLQWQDDVLVLRQTLSAEHGVPEGNAHVFRIGDRLIFGTTLGGYRLHESGQKIEPDPWFGNTQLGEEKDIFRLNELRRGQVLGVIGGVSDIWYATIDEDKGLQWEGQVLKGLATGFTGFFALLRDQIWMSRLPQLLRVAPDEMTAKPQPASQVHVRQMAYTDTQDVLLSGSGAQPLADPLSYRSDALRFSFALASYRQSERNEYRVRLTGLEDNFSPWSRETRRDYTNLSGGQYQFEVEARNVEGEVFRSKPLAFVVRPPGYLSPPALAAYGLAALTLLWLAGWLGQRRRQAVLLARQQELETEVAQRTHEVRQQALELKALNEAQSRFFANVSHEFRTPLTLARGPLEELASGRAGELGQEARQHVAMALRNTHTLQGLIGQILDLKRLESGEMPVSIAQDNLATLIREGVLTFVNQAETQEVTLSTQGIEDPVIADYDPGHFQQVIRNLMSNAMKFSPKGSTIAVTLTGGNSGDTHDDVQRVILTVSDQGPGIGEEDLPRIFDRYYQGDQTSASEPGTGIGLALVKDLIELHQGQVSVSNNPGGGARFQVVIPQELPELRQEPGPAQVSQQALPNYHGDDIPTILLVDDNQELRGFLSMRLSANYRILQAENGEQGLAMARAETPDVIVSDVMMPVMDGLAMTRALKSDPNTLFIPILLLSAKITKRDTVSGLEQGADDYLGKPFDTAELATRVAGLISSRKRLRDHVQADRQPQRSAFMTRAHEVLDQHLGDGDFGPKDWAQALHMDRTTLYRQLKKETDASPEDYLREQRLQRAASLLKAKAGNVSQVAMTVGFNSVSYFSRRFKERFDVTPAQYSQSNDG
ncbi:MAG: ATP-binding protein [Lysobacterales bacterium]